MTSPSRSFEALDFARLWRGRDQVDRLEQAVVRTALGDEPISRLLEIGTGNGRLTATLQGRSDDYVGIDLTRRFVVEARRRVAGHPNSDFVAADTYHLPFASASFSAATLIRVYNFLRSPADALREVARCLIDGGVLVLSYHPHPSWSTLVDDLKSGLHPDPAQHRESMTWSHRPVVEVRPSSFPAWSPTPVEFDRIVRLVGFRIEREYGTGWEDNRIGRVLPERCFTGLSQNLRPLPAASVRFVRMRKESSVAGASSPVA